MEKKEYPADSGPFVPRGDVHAPNAPPSYQQSIQGQIGSPWTAAAGSQLGQPGQPGQHLPPPYPTASGAPPYYNVSNPHPQQPGFPPGYPPQQMFPGGAMPGYPGYPAHQAGAGLVYQQQLQQQQLQQHQLQQQLLQQRQQYPAQSAQFDAGARFNPYSPASIPPPPPGHAPNAAQVAAANGQHVVTSQKKEGFFKGTGSGGYTFW